MSRPKKPAKAPPGRISLKGLLRHSTCLAGAQANRDALSRGIPA